MSKIIKNPNLVDDDFVQLVDIKKVWHCLSKEKIYQDVLGSFKDFADVQRQFLVDFPRQKLFFNNVQLQSVNHFIETVQQSFSKELWIPVTVFMTQASAGILFEHAQLYACKIHGFDCIVSGSSPSQPCKIQSKMRGLNYRKSATVSPTDSLQIHIVSKSASRALLVVEKRLFILKADKDGDFFPVGVMDCYLIFEVGPLTSDEGLIGLFCL